jgi:16S rRNA (guanine527-N7)-methyltransferase
VAALPVLLELALPLLKPGGLFIAHKGPAVRSEWASARVAAGLLGARLQDLIPTDIPGQAWAHVLVVARQTVSAPAQYPRKAGEPERHPLGLLQTNEGGAL